MDSEVKIYLKRANNEIMAAEILDRFSEDNSMKSGLTIPLEETFYSSVISHCYYAIFYAAKAILLTKNIKTSFPEVHRKTLEEFKKNFVDTGILDLKLLEIYREMMVRADDLLEIFKTEKGKRGYFTYTTIPQANKIPAKDSMKNSKLFVSNINKVLENL